uniref:Uncharacterized protein n=1 Tax=Ditylenchus dipsaci TaxID=166011 RepID=A0A915DD02_9BILA
MKASTILFFYLFLFLSLAFITNNEANIITSMNIEFDVASESLYKKMDRRSAKHSRLNKIISGKNSSKKGFIEQKLDHFNSFEQRTWKQSLAEHFGAAMFALEHRYYGDSLPFDSFTTENLKYLTSQQALADFKLQMDCVWWILPRNACCLSKQMYPDLILGAVASSAPVQAKADFREYFQVVENAVSQYGSINCSNNFRQYFSSARALLQTSEGRKKLGICEISKTDDSFEKNMQIFYDHEVDMLADQCRETLKLTLTYSALAKIDQNVSEYIDSDNLEKKCFDISYKNALNKMKNVQNSIKPWMYQTCNEFGFYQTTHTTGGMFDNVPLPLRFNTDLCSDVFGKEFDAESLKKSIQKTNQFYGGSQNFNSSNTIFINGSEDPWHPLSVYDTPNDSVESILILGTSHCQDFSLKKRVT